MSTSPAIPRLPWLETSSPVEQFFLLAQERYRIKLRRDRREPGPWTDDPVLQKYRFCNVHREHDKTTQWFREKIREPLAQHPGPVLVSTVAFRWFNRIETGERILYMLKEGDWSSNYVREQLAGVSPLVTGAYMVKTPAAMNKLEGIIWCMDQFFGMGMMQRLISGMPDERETLQGFHRVLTQAPYLGEFMAYEIVSDLRWTCLLRNAPDIMTWANPGPGCARGLGWIFHNNPEHFNRHSAPDVSEMQTLMARLLEESRHPSSWPRAWPAWEMREVEHWLCEYDKWCRGHYLKQPLKRKFEAAPAPPEAHGTNCNCLRCLPDPHSRFA